MSKPVNQAFNVAADKVVSFKELRQKRTEFYKANLSVGERIYLNVVDKPVSAVVGIIIAVKDVLAQNKKEGMFVDSATSDWYVSGAFMNAAMKDAQSLVTSSRFDEKINNLFCQAFEQCEDVSKKPVMQRLKPL